MLDKKEMTALVLSVGADERQPSQKVCKNSIPASDKEINENVRVASNPLHLHTVSMTELYQTTYASRPPIIDGLLYAGAYILAGAPKIGKSFLVAQLAYHVSAGSRLWNYKVHQGAVLYLALEDDFQRIQSRMFMMYGVEDSEKLYFATAANKVGQGLNDQLENFIKEHADTKLIIIDTMQKIREFSGEAYSYASDYAIIGQLKQFADKHGVCLLIVHHTRKQPAEDSFDMVSGTNGLSGSADGTLLMQKKKRTGLDATVDVVGRDQQDQILYLKKDPHKRIYQPGHTSLSTSRFASENNTLPLFNLQIEILQIFLFSAGILKRYMVNINHHHILPYIWYLQKNSTTKATRKKHSTIQSLAWTFS